MMFRSPQISPESKKMDFSDETHSFKYLKYLDCIGFGFPRRLVSGISWGELCNWKLSIWHLFSIFSCFVSIVSLTAALGLFLFSSELTTAIDKMNVTLQANQRYIAANQKRLDYNCLFYNDPMNNPNYNKYKRVTLGCGGIIRLPSAGNSMFLDYKSRQSYENHENCLWVLDSPSQNAYGVASGVYSTKIQIAVLCDGFGTGEVRLSVVTWLDFERLTFSELRQNKGYQPSESHTWNFLSFTTNGDAVGIGFALRVDVLETTTVYSGRNEAFTSSPGTVTYKSNKYAKDGDKISIVINPPVKSFSLTLDYMETKKKKQNGTCDDWDSMHIYKVGESGSQTKIPTLCGTVKNRTFVLKEPILVAFVTSALPTARGFKLSWKQT